ncbi:MAG: 4'-phosphopantetheinyl transferase superfamily protein [Rhodanobacteraceae bacterium]|nr:MAG: 4'-phosphopantetheinyl transferase superfamily protein [Rhodanobacteraceae bacterium]
MAPRLDFVEAVPGVAAARLAAGSIHLWRIPYALSQGRAPLIGLLAAYLGIPASQVALDQNAKGKPRLNPAVFHSSKAERGATDKTLSFNWSHSGDYALIALSREAALGVDIERLGKNLRALEIARRYFDPAEAETLATLELDARNRAFIGLWCAKEAVLKAVGEGLSFGLARLAFARCGESDWRLERLDPALGHADAWQLAGFDAAPGYRGALAWRGNPREILAFRPA